MSEKIFGLSEKGITRTKETNDWREEQILKSSGGGSRVKLGGDDGGADLAVLASDPSSPSNDDTWINSTSKVLKYVSGGAVNYIGVSRGAPAAPTDGDLYIIVP